MFQRFFIRKFQRLCKSFYVRLHNGCQLRKTYSANGRILVEHTDIVEIVQFAEDTELGEFRYSRDEYEFKVWVEHL